MTEHWTQQEERSNAFWIIALLRLGQLFGRRLTRLLLPFIVGYFLLFAGQSRHYSRQYLNKILPRTPRWRDVARHFHCFASTILDRLFLFAGRDDYFAVENPDATLFDELASQGRGALLMISHVGSFDVLRLAVHERQDGLRLRVLMDMSQGAQLNAVLRSLNPALLDSIIDTSQRSGADLMLTIREELAAGAVIAVMADRVHKAGERCIEGRFLGGTVQLPAGPWLIGQVMQVPIFMGLGLYQGGNRYRLRFEQLSDGKDRVARGQREQMIAQQAQDYLNRLQAQLRTQPYNWFNFYDFWAQSPGPDQNAATTS